MHTLEQLAHAKQARNIARYQALIDLMQAQTSLTGILAIAPLTFDRDLGCGLDSLANFEVACAMADRVFASRPGEPYVAVSLSFEGPGVRVSIRTKNHAMHAYLHETVLLEEWDFAMQSVAARIARDEECAGRGAAMNEAQATRVVDLLDKWSASAPPALAEEGG